MARYLAKAHRLIGMTKYFKISRIPHIENSRASALAKSTSADAPGGKPLVIPSVRRPTVTTIEEAAKATHPDWREDILRYKKDVTLPTDKGAARRVKRAEAWIEHFTLKASEADLGENLNLLEKHRTETHLTTLHYQRAMAQIYNRKVCPRSIDMGDLVLRKAEASDPRHSHGKLAPRWKDPYRVV
ncbi:hypothetical protein BHE74_00032088 [Ensete ventricosum]|nr:hypothetical protein GW17_00051478 [Ensete ventricosum]RWW60876.1 hypothetical protein BHE74_00032088 [Ensete ventricosum]